MATENDKVKDFNEAYNLAWPSFGAWQGEARMDIRSYLGDIFTADEKRRLRLRGSDILNIQLIRRLVKWVAGYQADHRKGIKYDPVETSDIQTADDFTELATYVTRRAKMYELISKSFEHSLKTGLTLVNIYNDVNMDTNLDHFFYNQFLLDPGFTRLDLRDCRYGIIRKYITKAQAKILLPQDKHGAIDGIDDERPTSDEKFPNYKTPTIHGLKMIAYDEFQEKTMREEIVIINRTDGTEHVWDGTKKQLREQLPLILQQRGIPPQMVSTFTRQKETVEVSAFLNGEIFNTATDPFGLDDFSYTPIWCYYDPEHDDLALKLQGFVRSLREIQRAESKRVIAMVAWFENSIAQGLDFEKNTLVDLEDAWATGSQPRQFKEGALANNRVRDRAVPPFPQGTLDLHQVLEDAMPKTIGITPEMLGNMPNDSKAQISGLVHELRIGAGLTGVRGLFDDLSTSQNIIGDKLQKLMQAYPVEKVKRILGREPSPAFYSKNFGKFDSQTAESALTDTQINTRYQEMLQLKRMGAEVGDPAPITWGDLIELAPIQMKTEMLQKLQQREQAAMEQKKQQIQQQNELQQLTIETLKSTILMQNTQSTENQTKAVKNLTSAELDEAKSQGAVIKTEGDLANNLLSNVLGLGKLSLEQQKLNQPLQKGGE